MKIADHLSEKQRKKLNQIRITLPKKKKKVTKQEEKPKKQEEKLSERDLLDLMGSNNRGLKRKKGGAWTN